MPRKNFRRPKRVYKRKRVPGWGGAIGRVAGVGMKYVSKGGIAYKALRLARKVANAVNTEYHYYDYLTGATTIDYSGAVNSLLTNISQGTGQTQRVGDSMKLQNITMRYSVARNGGDALLRCIIVWDPQNKVSAVGDVLDSAYVGAARACQAPKAYNKRFQTRILYDRTHVLDASKTLQYVDTVIPIDQHTTFNQGLSTIASGDLKMLLISNIAPAGVNPAINFIGRLTFTDN